MRQPKEPWQNTHGVAVRAFPAVDGIDCLPFLFLNECHKSIHVTSSGIAAEFTVRDMKDRWQGSYEESSRQSGIVAKKTEGKTEQTSANNQTYTTSTLATLMDKSSLHDPKSFQIGSKFLQAGHQGA